MCDLAEWRTALGRLLVRLVARVAELLARVLRWSTSNVALILTAGVGLALVWAFTAVTAEVYEDVVDRDGIAAIGLVAAIGLALTLVPTLLLTRKYLKV